MRERASQPQHRGQAPGVAQRKVSDPGVARALTLQRRVGNRAAARVRSRWAAHPVKEKKLAMAPDSAAEDYDRFNPPQNS